MTTDGSPTIFKMLNKLVYFLVEGGCRHDSFISAMNCKRPRGSIVTSTLSIMLATCKSCCGEKRGWWRTVLNTSGGGKSYATNDDKLYCL